MNHVQGHTQKNGAVSEVIKEFISHPTWVQHTHCQQRELSRRGNNINGFVIWLVSWIVIQF
jgi:hypothetical protein